MDEKKYRELCDQLEDEQCKIDMFKEMLEVDVLLTDGRRNIQLTDSESELVLYHLINVKQNKVDFIKKRLEKESTR